MLVRESGHTFHFLKTWEILKLIELVKAKQLSHLVLILQGTKLGSEKTFITIIESDSIKRCFHCLSKANSTANIDALNSVKRAFPFPIKETKTPKMLIFFVSKNSTACTQRMNSPSHVIYIQVKNFPTI